jgi:hypothetical protein
VLVNDILSMTVRLLSDNGSSWLLILGPQHPDTKTYNHIQAHC